MIFYFLIATIDSTLQLSSLDKRVNVPLQVDSYKHVYSYFNIRDNKVKKLFKLVYRASFSIFKSLPRIYSENLFLRHFERKG